MFKIGDIIGTKDGRFVVVDVNAAGEPITVETNPWRSEPMPDKKKEGQKLKAKKQPVPLVGRFFLPWGSTEWRIKITADEGGSTLEGDIIAIRKKTNDELVVLQLTTITADDADTTLYDFEVLMRAVTEEQLKDVTNFIKDHETDPMPDLKGDGITHTDEATGKQLQAMLHRGFDGYTASFEHGQLKQGHVIDISGHRCLIGEILPHPRWKKKGSLEDGGRPEYKVEKIWGLVKSKEEETGGTETKFAAVVKGNDIKGVTKMARKESNTATSVIMGAIGVASTDELVDFAARRLARFALARGNIELAETIVSAASKQIGKAALAMLLLGAATALAAPDEEGDVSEIGTVAGLFIEPLKGAATAGLGVLVKEGLHGFSAFSQEDEKDLAAAIEAAKEGRKEEQKEVKELKAVAAQAKAQKTL